MRAFLASVGAAAALVAAAGSNPAIAQQQPSAQQQLRKALAQGMKQAGNHSGAYVVDLDTGETLFSAAADTTRLPASVEKLYTTATALLRFGAGAMLTTSILGTGTLDSHRAWHGTLYLKGGGDPTFGSASFDRYAYGTGATVQRLVANFIRATGITAVYGTLIGDASYFDSLRGTPPYGYRFSPEIEGSLSAVAFDRGLINQGSSYVARPALYAATQLAAALRAAHVKVGKKVRIRGGKTPPGALQLAAVHSPRLATLVELTLTPSDNFFAEMLLKGLGARFGSAGTTAAGTEVVKQELAGQFGIEPQLDDGSGLSRHDLTSPRQVVAVLGQMETDAAFVDALAVAGKTGTLQDRMLGTRAQGRCRGKTGSLHDASNLVGYCEARDGDTLAFAFMMNAVTPDYARPIQDQMAEALAGYDG